MRALTLILILIAGSANAAGSDYEAACQMVIDAKPELDPVPFMKLCTCAYGVIEEELGTEFTTGYSLWETGQAPLAEVLPEGMSEDDFFAALGGIADEKYAPCAP